MNIFVASFVNIVCTYLFSSSINYRMVEFTIKHEDIVQADNSMLYTLLQ